MINPQQRRGRLAAPNGAELIPQIDPTVAAMTNRAQAQLARLPDFNRPAVAEPAAPMQNAQGMQWQGNQGQDIVRGGAGNDTLETDQDKYAAMGFASNVPRSLIKTESGGNWAAANSETGAGGAKGHYGILQFGHARYGEAQAAGAVPQGMTIEQFASNSPEGRQAQISASNWHFDDIDRRITKAGYNNLIGQNIGGVNVSMNGMRAMAHLGGFGGLSKFLNTGGSSNPADAFGTSLAAYGKTHRN